MKEKYVIEVTYGSVYQRILQSTMIRMFLQVLEMKMKDSHKSNRIKITYPKGQ